MMAKVNAPLLSMGASGTIGGVQTYSSWRGVRYARQRVIPSNPNTIEQQKTRGVFSTLNYMWKVAGPLLRAPWDVYALGQPQTGRNAFIGQNTRNLRGKTTMADFIGSPGARGGLPPTTVSAAPTVNPGELNVTIQLPSAPTGWQVAATVAVAFLEQDPMGPFQGSITEAENATSPFSPILITGLTSGQPHVVSAWIRWLRPDGSEAYGASLNTTATPA